MFNRSFFRLIGGEADEKAVDSLFLNFHFICGRLP